MANDKLRCYNKLIIERSAANMKKKLLASIFLVLLFYISSIQVITYANTNNCISYQVHVKDYGWMKTVNSSNTAGTTGESKRMEAIKINLNGIEGSLKYQVHVETYGWLPEISEGKIAGTTGQGKRMEAIIIKLENSSYTIKYRVHAKDLGWMNWVESGQIAGTTGESRRIEAIQIVIEKDNNIVEEEIINFGIDVSKHQGIIDWSQVKTSGVKFAMIRCGYRGYTEGGINEDIQFINNIRGAYINGIKVGLYFYSSAINETEAIEEANFVLNLINKYNIGSYISYPIAIDIEDFEGTRNYNLSIKERTNIVKAFCNAIQNSGYKPMVYSYTYFLEEKLHMNELASYDIWIADYYGNTWYKRPYTIWQYTDKGKINGINGNVDLNYSYRNY